MDTGEDGYLVNPEGPDQIYKEIKEQHFMFIETPEARQLRVKSEWENLRKGKNNALVFGAEWIKALAEMDEVGLPPNPKGLGLDYLTKINQKDAEAIRKDRREWPTADGGKEVRVPRTWQEMHEVLVENEGITFSQKAINAARQGGQQRETPTGEIDQKTRKGKGAGKGDGVTPEKDLSLIHI